MQTLHQPLVHGGEAAGGREEGRGAGHLLAPVGRGGRGGGWVPERGGRRAFGRGDLALELAQSL